MAQKIWIEKWRTTDGKLDEFSEMFLERQYDDDVEFLALTMAEVAAICNVIRKLDQCGVCHGKGTVTSLRAWDDNTCAQCSGTGFGAAGMEVWEILK